MNICAGLAIEYSMTMFHIAFRANVISTYALHVYMLCIPGVCDEPIITANTRVLRPDAIEG